MEGDLEVGLEVGLEVALEVGLEEALELDLAESLEVGFGLLPEGAFVFGLVLNAFLGLLKGE